MKRKEAYQDVILYKSFVKVSFTSTCITTKDRTKVNNICTGKESFECKMASRSCWTNRKTKKVSSPLLPNNIHNSTISSTDEERIVET